ncbi:MAG: DUF2247 family protein [Clostridia bacterium]|nr:DUF2247 family protein [Clostridia bacterium]
MEYLLNNKIWIVKNMGFKITWKFLNIGLKGYDVLTPQISKEDIFDFVDSLLTRVNDETDNIVSLICVKGNNMQSNELIQELADNDDSKNDIQFRKWQVFLLKKVIDKRIADPFEGILSLQEFWASMGVPSNMPTFFPRFANSNEAKIFYSKPSYDNIINVVSAWQSQEITAIINAEKHIKTNIE